MSTASWSQTNNPALSEPKPERPYDKYEDDKRVAFSARAAALRERAIAEGWSAPFYMMVAQKGEEIALQNAEAIRQMIAEYQAADWSDL